ncbi:MAG TPA: YaiO family outer membrane beta-barrel protein [Acidiferrobacter sp.]|nr:YaiO family outer membrane beta-barrel protein [Acidiferrobacter sp.]
MIHAIEKRLNLGNRAILKKMAAFALRLALATTLGATLFCGAASAAGVAAKPPQNTTDNYRIDANVSYYYLQPHNTYGQWHVYSVKFYNNSNKQFNYFLQAIQTDRTLEGSGFLGIAGVYSVWTPRFYTYSDISSGTNYTFLPQFRVDNNFHYLFLSDKSLDWELGGGYLKYNGANVNYLISTGPTYYYKDWIFTYRLIRTISDPGNVGSWSSLYSIGYGRRYWQRTYLNVTVGREAYLTTYLPQAQQSDVNYKAVDVELKERIWLKRDFGIIGKLEYIDVEQNYKATGIDLSIFKKF